jgi:two-component system OmpR family response regulator
MTASNAKILLVEDEVEIAAFIKTLLQSEGFEVRCETDGRQGFVSALQEPPDLIILDRMLPGMDGLEFCRRLRKSAETPILMLTALDKPAERVEGLNAGANDYLPKPFDLDELIARVRVQLRTRKDKLPQVLVFSDIHLDLGTREVARGDRMISLTPKEFDLLTYFMRHPRQVLTRTQIFNEVWGDDCVEENSLEVYVRYLRTKLETPEQSRVIHTVRGVGYVLRS